MDEMEMKKISLVLYNKICKELKNKKLDITPFDIEKALLYHEDLSQIYTVSLKEQFSIDLNDFYRLVCVVRIMGMDSYIACIENTLEDDIESLIKWLPQIMECFTDLESLELKKVFLKRVTHYQDLNCLDNQEINRFFWSIINDLEKNSKKRVMK